MQMGIPETGAGDRLGGQACRYHRLGFHGLLIESSPFAAARVEALATDGHEMALGGLLDFAQPLQRVQSRFDQLLSSRRLAADQERVRQHGIAIGETIFKPGPVGGIVPTIQAQKPLT